MATDIFDYLYSCIRGSNRWLLLLRVYSLLRYLVRSSANLVLPVYFRITSKSRRYRLNEPTLDGNSTGVVVSLTTFPGRIDTVWLAIETLLRQSVKPDAVIVWLSKDEFPNLDCLPNSLLQLVDRGLKIELREGNLRSHKKYYYARQEFPNATLVLADDDIFYPTTVLKELLDISRSHRGIVVCRFAKRINWDSAGRLGPYINWERVNESVLRTDIFFGSGGGVLIPPSAVHEDILNDKALLKTCPLADDIWLNVMCRLISREMISTRTPFSMLPVVGTDCSNLSSVNIGEQMNDRQLEEVRKYCLQAHGVDPFTRPA